MDQKVSQDIKQKFKDYKILRTLFNEYGEQSRLAINKKTGDCILLQIYTKEFNKGFFDKIKAAIEKEKMLFSTLQHPFIIKMFEFIQIERNFFFFFEYHAGGNIFSLVHRFRPDNDLAVFYAAQVVLLLEYLHSKDIVFRSIRSEIFHIGSDGYLKVAKFYHAKQLTKKGRTYSMSGQIEYIAPEILLNKGHGLSSDWWSLGVLIYELVTQITPFGDDDQLKMYDNIIKGKVGYPKFISQEAKSLIKQLLEVHPSLRLGNGGVNDIKKHKWFQQINWEELGKKNIQPPHIPKINGPEDTSNYYAYDYINQGQQSNESTDDFFIDW